LIALPPIAEPEIIATTPAPPQSQLATTPQSVSREGLAPEIWVIGLVGVIVILLVLFGVAR
jgi:hypothetical protein